MKPQNTPAAGASQVLFLFITGLFLGLCLWKFGDPVILDQKIATPRTISDYWNDAWPTHWANWIWPALMAWGSILLFGSRVVDRRGQIPAAPGCKPSAGFYNKWLWLLPLAWLGWQFLSASQTVDAGLTTATLWQYAGCVAFYFLGALMPGRDRYGAWVLIGLLIAFAFCLVRAVDQRIFEYPQNLQELVDGERGGWTNFPPRIIQEMKAAAIIITTNGADVANPVIVTKFTRGRVCGTLVYPNALAEIILLLWPLSLALAWCATKNLRPLVRGAAIAVTFFLGGAAFFWTGSKLGWLIGLGLAGVALLRLDWSRRLKGTAVALVFVIGLGVFAVRFHHYFEAGATSAGARFDYWRAACQTAMDEPLFGTGPGTFQRPYARLKAPESEMARLAHNDYLEQFSDSGFPGGILYCGWILAALAITGRKCLPAKDSYLFAIWIGLLGWFTQSIGEFGLFVPALAWTAFALLGYLAGRGLAMRP